MSTSVPTYAYGPIVTEGKTKILHAVLGKPGLAVFYSKDDITAGDGAKREKIKGKSILSTATNCNVFRLLNACGVNTAFIEQLNERTFLVKKCKMIPLEVVARREAHGSFIKRNPRVPKGHVFSRLFFELFLKTSGDTPDKQVFNGHEYPWGDPLIRFTDEKSKIELISPKVPDSEQVFELTTDEVGPGFSMLDEIQKRTRQIFLILEKAWQILGMTLVDFKLEFGIDEHGNLLLADVVDNESWRLVENGEYWDKQSFRDGEALTEVERKFRRISELSGQFRVPKQRVILWTGSDKDNRTAFEKAIEPFLKHLQIEFVTCSMHKEPERGIGILRKLEQEVPDSVVIAYIGRSNGAGPTLSAHTHVPLICVPASGKDFPDDVWSSLRTPSAVPCSTILEPENAVLHALQILAGRNPALYAKLRLAQEERFTNTIPV